MRSDFSPEDQHGIQLNSQKLFEEHHQTLCQKTDRLFVALLGFQFVMGIVLSLWVSPRTWIGKTSSIHPHVWVAFGLGALISLFPVFLAMTRPGRPLTRHAIAVGQMLWSALLIHLTGGRIETHFHVFGSLAFLAFYRDWRVLLTATVVVATDHALRGLFWPQSVYGVFVSSEWRWVEHAAWVIFEDVTLFAACRIGINEGRQISVHRAETQWLSERRLEALREFESLVNTVEGLVWEADAPSMRFTFVSRQSEAMLGCPASRWTSEPDFWKGLIHGEDQARVQEAFAHHATGGGFFELEYRLQTAGGKVLIVRNAVNVIIQTGQRPIFRGILTDITERKRLDSMKDEFISNVSHELRTPLTSIRGSLGLVASGVTGPLPPKAKSMVDLASQNTERLVRLVNDILDIQKIGSGGMQMVFKSAEVMPLICQAVESHRGFAQSCGVNLDVTDSLQGAFVRVDSDRITQVLMNLLSNASKFSPRGETVSVSVTRRGRSIRMAISDRGPGIPESFKARVFQKFAQAETADTRLVQGKGTGLGLSISKAIMAALGGTIGFDSEPGRGTTFYVELPEEVHSVPHLSSPEKRGRILTCDHELDNCAVLKAILEKEG